MIAKPHAVLLDFDGPIADVFADYPAHQVCADMWSTIDSSDPLEVLRHSPQSKLEQNEQTLASAERQALQTAPLTPGADTFIRTIASKLPIVIVSNNSANAIRSFVVKHQLHRLIDGVFGRPPNHPDRMKPSPYLLNEAVNALDTAPSKALFIGDSLSDIRAANAAQIPVVALANKPHKVSAFTAYDIPVVASMTELLRLCSDFLYLIKAAPGGAASGRCRRLARAAWRPFAPPAPPQQTDNPLPLML